MCKILVWFRSHLWLTAMLLLLALGVSLHFYLGWHAERRWERYCVETRTRGVKLNIVELAPPVIPDEQNFAALPMMKTALVTGKSPFALPYYDSAKSPFGDPVKGVRIDWKAWQTAFLHDGFITEASEDPVRDTIRALDHYAPQFQEWSQWRTRPECRFPLELEKGPQMPMPHMQTFSYAARVFALRMRAHLALGDSAAAYADFRNGFQVYPALRKEPSLLSSLVRATALSTLLFSTGEGLRDHAWTAEDLAKIETDLRAVDLPADFHLGISADRASTNVMLDFLSTTSGPKRQEFYGPLFPSGKVDTGTMLMLMLTPKYLFRDNEWRVNIHMDRMLARVDASGHRFNSDVVLPSPGQEITGPLKYYYFMYLGSAGVYSDIDSRFLRLQVLLDQTRVALALEQYFQAHGRFPVALDELPHRLPEDLYSHSSFRYRPIGSGSFNLYSVGANRVDDGGVIDPQKKQKEQADDIWLFAPPPSSPQ